MSLNPAQRAAVEYLAGPLLVLAGAGSGKTRVITEKIAHLARQGVAPDRIYAITFTNKAAREMAERTERLFKRASDPRRPSISTFHALGLRALQLDPAAAGLRRGFSVFDGDDSAQLVRELAKVGAKPDTLQALRSAISGFKNEGFDPVAAAAAARSPREVEAAELYAAYQRRLSAFNAVDFDDLIALPVRMLEADAQLATRWRERVQYLLIDEYQDTNGAQYRLLRALAGARGALTVVGDDDQSIYAWRGAKPENLNQLKTDYPALQVIKLERNYRSTRRVLRAANALIAHNPHLFDKVLYSEGDEGPPIQVWRATDDKIEAERVAADVAYRQQSERSAYSEFAVLYRGNHQARGLEQALRMASVPYRVIGATAFFERAEVKDLLAWLRIIANPDDDTAFLRAVRAPTREIGASTLEALGELAGAQHLSLLKAAMQAALRAELSPRPAAQLAEFVGIIARLRALGLERGLSALAPELVAQSGYLEYLKHKTSDAEVLRWKLATVDDLVEWLGSGAIKGRLDDVVAQLAVLAANARDDAGNQVRLMTIHSAKGLEFRHVYVIGCEEGLLPHEASVLEGRIEEERRLFYVAITRAKAHLTLSHAAAKTRFGQRITVTPSRFIAELPVAELRIEGDDPQADAHERACRARGHLDRLAALFEP